MMDGCSFLDFSYFLLDHLQDRQKIAEKLPQRRQVGHLALQIRHLSPHLAILRSKFAILAPIWRHDGRLSAILPLTWPILAPRKAPRDP